MAVHIYLAESIIVENMFRSYYLYLFIFEVLGGHEYQPLRDLCVC